MVMKQLIAGTSYPGEAAYKSDTAAVVKAFSWYKPPLVYCVVVLLSPNSWKNIVGSAMVFPANLWKFYDVNIFPCWKRLTSAAHYVRLWPYNNCAFMSGFSRDPWIESWAEQENGDYQSV